jgi:hypothetical protein
VPSRIGTAARPSASALCTRGYTVKRRTGRTREVELVRARSLLTNIPVAVAAAITAIAVAAILFPGHSSNVTGHAVAGEMLTGREYAAQLSLENKPWPVEGGCSFHVTLDEQTPDEVGYCLDDLGPMSDEERQAAADLILGHVPSAVESKIRQLSGELDAIPATPDTEAQRAVIMDEILALVKSLEAS